MTDVKRALLIGINYIGTSSELGGCINDTKHINDWLINNFDYSPYNITILTELQSNTKLRPTYKNIIREMQNLIKDSKPGSHHFILYSGHGSYTNDINGDETDKKDECICPLDYNTKGYITDDDIRKILIDPLPEGAYLHGIFDSCHSGTIGDLRYKCINTITSPSVSTIQLSCDELYPNTNAFVCILSGCKDEQTSADTTEENIRQGALCYCLLSTYKNQITYKSLIRNLSTFIKYKKYKQIPQLSFGTDIALDTIFDV